MTGQLTEAEESYRNAAKLLEQLSRDYPERDEYRASLAQIHHEFGMLYGDQFQKLPEARRSYEAAAELRERLVRDSPDQAKHQDDLAWTYHNLSAALHESGDRDAAEVARTKAVALRENLVRNHPTVDVYAVGLAASHVVHGNRKQASEPAAAIKQYDLAVPILEPLLQRESPPRDARQTLMSAYWGRAKSLVLLQRFEEAIPELEKTISFRRQNQNAPMSKQQQEELASMYRSAAKCYRLCGQEQEAHQAERDADLILQATQARE
jgi:hypothetical protein